jgi:signal transduction histidine kinase
MDESGGSGGSTPEARRIRELEEALRAELRERQRLEGSCEEARKLVHTLNNALSIIATFAAELDDEIAKDSPLREGADEISRAAKRAATIARKLSDLLRGGKGEAPGHGRA